MKDMIFSKLISAVIASIILGGFYLLLELKTGSGGYFLFAIIFSFIGNIVYGIPVSFFSDYVTKKIGRIRFLLASLLHLVFGLLSTILIGELGVYAVVCSFIFFLSEEAQRMRKHNRRLKSTDKVILTTNTLGMVIIFSLALYVSMLVSGPLIQEKTHEYYLIPKGYEGEVRVVYNVKNASLPKKIGDFDVYHINEQGYSLTPLSERGGLVENQYFYIDTDGKKEKIDDTCIFEGGYEGIQTDDYEYSSSYFTITNSKCSEAYMINGGATEPEGLSLEEIIKEEGLN
jgi:hypothetical protein